MMDKMDVDDLKNGVTESDKKGEEVMIEKESFVLRVVYHEGHILTTGEAQALYQSQRKRIQKAGIEFKKQADEPTSNIASLNQLAEAFESPTVYRKGHPLTADEAKECNNLRRMNIREYAEKLIKKANNPEDSMTVEVARKAVMDHDETYELRAKPNLVEVEKKAKELAEMFIKRKLKSKGHKITNIDKDELNTDIENLAKDPRIVEHAESYVSNIDVLSEELKPKLSGLI